MVPIVYIRRNALRLLTPYALHRVDGKEVRAASAPGGLVIGHGLMVPIVYIRRNALRLLTPYGFVGLAFEFGE